MTLDRIIELLTLLSVEDEEAFDEAWAALGIALHAACKMTKPLDIHPPMTHTTG